MDLATRERLYRTALVLAFITVAYNLLEGVVSAWFGYADETLSLFGFGLDSFVEVASGAGFYLLTAGLIVSGAYDGYSRHAPKTAFWGIVVSLVSILSMGILIYFKEKVGRALGSQAMMADAACTRVCLYLSLILLASSAGYQLTGIGWLDAAGAFGISWFCFQEGHEAFAEARGISCGCSGSCR